MTMLNDQQAAGLEKVKDWYADRAFHDINAHGAAPVFRWFGYAGTGKTFTAARIPEVLDIRNVVFGTYTGKAASVLRRSLRRYGVDYPVTTIHSAIYFPTTSAEAREALHLAEVHLSKLLDVKAVLEQMPEDDPRRLAYVTELGWADLKEYAGELSEVSESIETLQANARRLRFEWNPESEWAYANLIILDEVSMVNGKLAADIEAYGVPILVLGDPAQLPPVEGGGHYTDAEPDHLLTQIMRQGEGSPVIDLATRIRQSEDIRLGLVPEDSERPSLSRAMAADVVLCWTNKRRWAMINAIRKRTFGLTGMDIRVRQPITGDTIMILTNNKDMAVFNGELFEVLAVVRETKLGPDLQVRSDEGVVRKLSVYYEGFAGQEEQTRAKNTGYGLKGNRALATFGQAITVHKAQGSQWPTVYVVNEVAGMISMAAKRDGRDRALAQARQWAYTAVTRAEREVIISRPAQ